MTCSMYICFPERQVSEQGELYTYNLSRVQAVLHTSKMYKSDVNVSTGCLVQKAPSRLLHGEVQEAPAKPLQAAMSS
ncbi:hypothetical protein I79_011263 [Cricetulus griseus]|uniref:Uncharacterized protein n=1 Tax=Cricetulus griseus TaxID=10029 RepID=G3HKN4_CRIGR|nr:hypothetical protein I79_011263 [Cricetulus griseus]